MPYEYNPCAEWPEVEPAECERCATPASHLVVIKGEWTCDDCADQIAHQEWEAKCEGEPLSEAEILASEIAAEVYFGDGVPNEPLCSVVPAIVEQATGIDQLVQTLKAHIAECALCGSTRKTVVDDRLYLKKPAAVCCGDSQAEVA